jgi:hypothetical protein
MSFRMYQRGLHKTGFREIWYSGLLWQSVEKIQTWLKANKNIGQTVSTTKISYKSGSVPTSMSLYC